MSKLLRSRRVRRTLDPSPENLHRLKRSLWGLTEAYTGHLIHEQEQELSARQREARRALTEQEQENMRLEREISELRSRLEMLRRVTDTLTRRVARTRETAAAMTQMLETEMTRLEREHAAAIGDLKFESVRVGAELQLERQAVRDFLSELYRVLSAHGAAPGGSRIVLPEPLSAGSPEAAGSPWEPLLTGRLVSRAVLAPDGGVIARAGDRVSPGTIERVSEKGLLPDLFLAVRHP